MTTHSATASQTMPTRRGALLLHGVESAARLGCNGRFLKGIAATLPAKPTAIVLVSGHWLQPTFSVTTAARPTLIYDYHGFPPHT